METKTVTTKEGHTHVVQTIDAKNKRITYHLLPNTSQAKHFSQINITGFAKLPSGFYKEGFGLAKPVGAFLVEQFTSKLGDRFELTITETTTDIKKQGSLYHVYIAHADYAEIQRTLKDFRKDSNTQCRGYVQQRLSQLFKKTFKVSKKSSNVPNEYQQDRLAKIIKSSASIAKELSKNDVTAVAELYAELLEKKRFGESVQQLKIIGASSRKTEKVILQKVVKEFESRLKKQLSENDWQIFLQKFILLFNTSYVQVLEKLSVSLQGKYPDFILLNIYNYLDIYEIKKPSTNLLKLDPSRGNYFWDTEVCKAISQTENYIHAINKNALAFADEVKRLKKVEVKVVRPRGFVIAGTRSQLMNAKMHDDFRLLSSASKNLDVIPYDDLLDNLKNLIKRL